MWSKKIGQTMPPDDPESAEPDPIQISEEHREHILKLLKEMQRLREESERLRLQSEELLRVTRRPYQRSGKHPTANPDVGNAGADQA